MDRLRKEHIRTSRDIPIEVLKRFLSKKLGHVIHSDFQLLTVVDSSPVVLPEDVTMNIVRRDICDDPGNIILYYRLFPMPELELDGWEQAIPTPTGLSLRENQITTG